MIYIANPVPDGVSGDPKTTALVRIATVLEGQQVFFASLRILPGSALFELKLLYQIPLTALIPCGGLSRLSDLGCLLLLNL